MRRNRTSIVTSAKSTEQRKETFVTVVILGDNHGHRMKSYGPVPLIKVGDKTVLEHQVQAVKAVFGNYEIVLCCGFQSEKVFKYTQKKLSRENIRIVENQIVGNTNDCEPTRISINNTSNSNIIVVDGGVLFSSDTLSKIKTEKNCVLTQHGEEDPFFGISVISEESKVQNMCLGDLPQKWTQIFNISGEREVAFFRDILSNYDYKTRFLFEAVNESIDRGLTFEEIDVTNTPVANIGNLKALKRVKR